MLIGQWRMVNGNDRQANAIVGNALVDTQLMGKRTGKRQMNVVLVVFYGYNASHTLYYSGKHVCFVL